MVAIRNSQGKNLIAMKIDKRGQIETFYPVDGSFLVFGHRFQLEGLFAISDSIEYILYDIESVCIGIPKEPWTDLLERVGAEGMNEDNQRDDHPHHQ